jgi:hypothetical protein
MGGAGLETDGASGPGSPEPTPGRPRPSPSKPLASATILDRYASWAPSAQAMVDIFKDEWSSALPDELGVETGTAGLFEDPRIRWVLEQLGSVEGASALELGPLEGGHTFMLCRAGAHVDAVEANSRAFLKCLIAKELLSITGARFLYGDFVEFLKAHTTTRWDFVLASGVLYHMLNPFELLTLMAGVTDRVAIWTHYFDKAILMNSAMARQFAAPAAPIRVGDNEYILHKREYAEALEWSGFCGGPAMSANWIESAHLMHCLEQLGFSRIDVAFDEPHHQNGPSLLLFAQRLVSPRRLLPVPEPRGRRS